MTSKLIDFGNRPHQNVFTTFLSVIITFFQNILVQNYHLQDFGQKNSIVQHFVWLFSMYIDNLHLAEMELSPCKKCYYSIQNLDSPALYKILLLNFLFFFSWIGFSPPFISFLPSLFSIFGFLSFLVHWIYFIS